MSSLSRFIKAIIKLFSIIEYSDNIEEIVLYMRDLILTKKNDIKIPIAIQNKAKTIFEKNNQLSNEERFYFKNSPNLLNLMTNLYVCSECRIPVCLVGATGLGKTSMARAFSEIVRREYAILYSFHIETQLNDLFGVFNFEAGKPVIKDGPLVKAMENGQIFIADEFNLAEESVLEAITIALEPSEENSMLLATDLGKKIKRKNSFFFIACQNDLSTSGRRKLPKIIEKRLRTFEYPSPMIKDLQSSIEEMIRFEKINDTKFNTHPDFPLKIANFTLKLNELKIPEIGKWSMRDIRKLYRRLTKQQIENSSYFNITIEHQIIFYILGSISGQVEDKLLIYDKISEIMKNTLDLKEELNLKIRNCIECKPRIIEMNEKKFLVKGDSQKTLEDKKKNEKLKKFTNAIGEAGILLDINIKDKIDLSSLYETLFYISFSHYKEPLLLCGPSGYKSRLAKIISPAASIINFYPDISNSQLIGNVSLVTNYQAKEYYLEQICKICKNENEKLNEIKDKLKEQLKDYYEEKKKEAIEIREKKLKEQRKKRKEEISEEEKNKIKDENKDKINLMNTRKITINRSIIKNFEDNLKKLVNGCKNGKEIKLPECLMSIVEHLKKNLIEFDATYTEGIFGDFSSVFKTGILTEKLLIQTQLIAENLPNLQTSVLERCNDLFNFNPKITLSEDTCNSFTGDDKELKEFSDCFRVIATSTELAIRNLSDAAQSRFTVIYTTSYTPEERDLLIHNFYEGTPKEFYDFLIDYKNVFRNELSLAYITKILNLLKVIDFKFNKYEREKEETKQKNLCLAIHLSLRYLIDKRKKKKFKNIINKILPDFYENKEKNGENKDEEDIEDNVPFEFKNDELYSTFSNISITSSDLKEIDCNLAFIKPFNKLLEHIFLSIAINYPLIIEGGTGKGKKSAIYYLAEILGYEVIYFNISNNTTIDDLFCKKMPVEKDGNMIFVDMRSRLLDNIDTKKVGEKNCVIILDNLQQANSNVLESLIPLFDINKKSILVQGKEIFKRTFNIFGIIDSSMDSKNAKDFLPDEIKYSTILYKNSKYLKRNYCRKIIDKMFGNEINDENEPKIQYYLNSYIKLNNYIIEKQLKELFSFNDFKKFLFFLINSRTNKEDPSSSIFDIQTLTQLLLVYKFKSKDEINSANEILGNSLASDFWPIFSYLSDEDINNDPENDEFQIAPDNKEKNLSYGMKNILSQLKRKKLLLKTHSLSPDQRRGIIFLMLSVLSDLPCVIQGTTASGKTHLIRLFCELLGREPLIIDINNETGISILLKQLIPKKMLEEKVKVKIIERIKYLIQKEPKAFGDDIKKIIDYENEINWLPSHFKKLIELLDEKIIEVNDDNLLLVSDLKSILNEQLSFFRHLSNEDSSFIKAMINGDWVILDGIESAQPELYQRLSSLCDMDNPNLTLYDNGPEYVYKKNSENERFKIHEDFRLFITYNPFEVESSKRLSQSFLNKCLTFSLGAIDENIKTTSLVLSGLFMENKLYSHLEDKYYENNKGELNKHNPSLKKDDILNNLLKEDLRVLGIKFASIHHYSNELVEKNREDFAAHKTFSGRSIKFILNSLKLNQNNINKGISRVIQDIYCNSYKKSQFELKKKLIEKFVDYPINELMQFLRNDEVITEEKYKTILKDLKKIKENPETSFDMCQFIVTTFAYIYKDIDDLINEIENCLISLDIENINYTYLSLFKRILRNYKTREGSENEIEEILTKKNINDLVLSKEDEYLRIPQNLLFNYQILLKKKLIKRISHINYLIYLEILDNEDKAKENSTEEENYDNSKDSIIIILNNEKQYIAKKGIKGKEPFAELCLDNSNLIGNFITLTLAYPELNSKSKDDLEKMFKNLRQFDKNLFILLIKLFNNSIYNEDKEEIFVCEQLSEFLEEENFIDAVENNYNKEELLKNTNPAKDKTLIEKCKLTKKKLDLLSQREFLNCINEDDIVKQIISYWNDNYDSYLTDLEENYYIKRGKAEELRIRKQFDSLIQKLKNKKSTINNKFVKGLLKDMIAHLEGITQYNEDNYEKAEIDVNNALRDSENYVDISTKTIFIHFPVIEYNNEYEPKGDFQKIYTLLMNYSDSINLLKEFEVDEDKRTCMNLGKLKKYLNYEEKSTLESMKNQYDILYEKTMSHSDKIIYYINNFKDCILSNLLMNIYEINKTYLNKNLIIEKLNNYCKRNIINRENNYFDIEWASYLSKTRDPFDEIIFPEYTSSSIIKLFTLKNKNDEDDKGHFSIDNVNYNKKEFYKRVNELSLEENLTSIDTIISIFKISIETIFNDKDNVKNVESIQNIFKEKFIEKVDKGKSEIREIINEIKNKISDISLIKLLEFINNLLIYLQNEEKNEINLDNCKKLLMDDIFFIKDINWKSDIKSEYKKYPSLLYFLFKYPNCEEELRQFLKKTDSIGNSDLNKFPTFLLIFRVFSDLNCLKLEMRTDNFLGKKIEEEILSNLKSKREDELKKSSDINWLGLLLNNSEINKVISPKMHFIYHYLENLCDYSFKPNKESETIYIKIIQNMIKSLIKIIFEGNLDFLFSNEIPKIEEEEIIEQEKVKNNILYFTKFPDIIQMFIKEKKAELDKEYIKLFTEKIKDLNEKYLQNSELYKECINAIEKDVKNEKERRIEKNYKDKKNKLESESTEIQNNCSGYLDTFNFLNDSNLSLEDYNKHIIKALKARNYLNKKSPKYFSKEIKHRYIIITFKNECKKGKITFGKVSQEILNIKTKGSYYINAKVLEKNKIKITTIINNNEEDVEFTKIEGKLLNINENYMRVEYEKAQNDIKSLKKQNKKDIKVILLINGGQKIDTDKFKNHESFKTLEKIMSGLKNQLNKSIDIADKNAFIKDNFDTLIGEFKNIYDSLKILKFQTPIFEEQTGAPTLINSFFENYKNKFKDVVLKDIDDLIKEYDDFNSKKKTIKINIVPFDESFSIKKFEKNRLKRKKLKIDKFRKFIIDYPYLTLLTDIDIPKLKFGYSSYNLTIGPIITSLYKGQKFIYRINSFVNKILSCKIIFDQENIDENSKKIIPFISVKDEIPCLEPISIIFTVPSLSNGNRILKGYLEIKVIGSEIEPLKVNFTFKIILLPLEIYFKSDNYSLYLEENILCLKNDFFKEKEILTFNYNIRNFEEDISLLNDNYTLENMLKYQNGKIPEIMKDISKKNSVAIKMPYINRAQENFDCLFNVYFTNKFSIPLKIKGKINKLRFDIFYYNTILDKVEVNKANIYIYKHLYKSKISFTKEMNFLVKISDQNQHLLKVKLPEIYYDDSYKIKFNYSTGKILYNREFSEYIKESTFVKVKVELEFPLFYEYYFNNFQNKKKKILIFFIDKKQKNFEICINTESFLSYKEKIFDLPYKTNINGEFKMLDEDTIKKININEFPLDCYNPYHVIFYKRKNDIDIFAHPGKYKDKKFFINGFKLIAFLPEVNNYWVPNADYFCDSFYKNYKILHLKKEEIKKAKNIILQILNKIRNKVRILCIDYTSYEDIKKIKKDELNKYGNFFDFILWLISEELTFNEKIEILINISKNMGEQTKEFLEYLISAKNNDKTQEIEIDELLDDNSYEEKQEFINQNFQENEDDKMHPIIYCNIIIMLMKILGDKYKLLKKNKFNISKILRAYKKQNLKNNIKLCFPPYDDKKIKEKLEKLIEPKIEKNAPELKSFKTWMINEFQQIPKPMISDEINKNDEIIIENKRIEGENPSPNLDLLKIKDLSLANSLDKIKSVLNNGFSISNAFILCCGKLDDTKIDEIFNYLYEIYHMTKNSTNSILSTEVKSFKNSFEDLCRSLKDSGVDLSEFEDLSGLTKKKSNYFLNVEKPSPILYSLPKGKKWHSEIQIFRNYNNIEEEEKEIEITFNKNKIANEENLDKNNKREEKKSEVLFNKENKIDFEKKGIEKDEALKEGDSDDDEEEKKIHFKKSETIIEASAEEIIRLKSISDDNVTIEIVKRMLNKKVDSTLKFPDSFPEFKSDIYGDRDKILRKTLNRIEGEDYVNKPLYLLINQLSKNLYIKFIQHCNNFDKKELCTVIALDLCRTIDKKYKLFHALIATAMANYFNSIEIPYAIVVFCDYGVQFIIKDFNEPHQEDVSQLIFEAIMVPRCSTRIANACYFISQKVNCKNRTNKKVFIISNGLDTKLKIGEKWASIFKNPKEKYCFYFVKPELKNELEANEIIKIWKDFQEKTKIELAIISQEDILNIDSGIYIPFKNIMLSDIDKMEEPIKKIKVIQPEFKEIVKFSKSNFINLLKSINEEIIKEKNFFVQNRIHIPSKGKYKLEDIKVKNSFLSFKDICYDEEYNLEQIDKDAKSSIEKLFSNPITSEMKLEYIEFIFTPNKPSMFSPSTKGTRLYLMGLINFCITHGQYNKIWLEKNKGLKKDYRVSVIIDSSISCFNDYMRPHSIKTVLAVLRLLSLVEIPFFDLIIATPSKPIVISCGNDTVNSLNPKSILWNILLEQLSINEEGCNLLDCLKLVYKLKSTNLVKKYYTFILTDGMFEQNESEEIQDYISFCEESFIEIFGIGLGYYPEGIKKIFNKCLWSLNPFMILKALTAFFGSGIKYLESLPLINFDTYNFADFQDQFKTIITKLNSYQVYKTLYGFLDGLPLLMESLDEITNPDLADEISFSNLEISNSNTMCPKGEFEGFKILIGLFWSCELSKTESEWVNKKYLLNRYDESKECLKEVLNYYLIDIVIKEDYKECIKELQTGNYYAHWIICSDNQGKLPNGGNANLIGQYIEALKKFWVNGGSLVFWNDNEPFTTECNLFLELAEFPGEISKTKVRFGGNHEGKKIMKPGNINIGISDNSEFGKFNNKRKFNDGKYPMFSLAHNLIKINEGTTISYVQDIDNIAPFTIFGYEHQGGANILFYTPPYKYNHGYIIIEGGFTKLFNELDTDGTKRYVLNIAAFTTQFAKRFGEIGENWKTDFKLTPFDFKIDETVKWKGFDKNMITDDFDIVYLIDATGSMEKYLAAARDQCINISEQLKIELPQFDFNFGVVFYRDPIDCPGEKNKAYSLKSDVNLLRNEISKECAKGGGDNPEDWVGGYDMALNNMAWRNGTRLIIHIADAPAHGSEWCNKENHESENPKLYKMIQKCVDKNIKIIGFQIGNYPKNSFTKFEKEYKKKGGILFKIYEFNNQMNANEISQHFKDMVIKSAHAAAPKIDK